ncbi:hypothetical protein QBC43DRAFT_306858, partial [Cladorrhinum sp. PSN259]
MSPFQGQLLFTQHPTPPSSPLSTVYDTTSITAPSANNMDSSICEACSEETLTPVCGCPHSQYQAAHYARIAGRAAYSLPPPPPTPPPGRNTCVELKRQFTGASPFEVTSSNQSSWPRRDDTDPVDEYYSMFNSRSLQTLGTQGLLDVNPPETAQPISAAPGQNLIVGLPQNVEAEKRFKENGQPEEHGHSEWREKPKGQVQPERRPSWGQSMWQQAKKMMGWGD